MFKKSENFKMDAELRFTRGSLDLKSQTSFGALWA
jgi:hypothetical protein